jgi:hypothetical protein
MPISPDSTNYWPPAESASEEILFVESLHSCTNEGEINRKVLSEKRRRLQRPTYPEGYFDGPQIEFVVVRPLHQETSRTEAPAPAYLSKHDSPKRDTHEHQSSIQSSLPKEPEESLDQS